MNKFDCVIAYYNEDLRPLYVVESLLKVKGIAKIITVDDGSTEDTTYRKLKNKFPKITSIRLNENKGKAEAIREGFKYVTSPFILLMDGDLTNIIPTEIERAFNKIQNDPKISMIIFRRVADKTVVVSKYLRHDIIFSGQRILKKVDLENSLKQKVFRYNLESAINSYMIKNHKSAYWMPLSVYNLFKQEKWGYSKGIFRIGIPAFIGFMTSSNIIYQTLFYCRNEVI